MAQDILNAPSIVLLEDKIIDIYHRMEANDYTYKYKEHKGAMISLLELRRELLNSSFRMNDEYKALLSEFNDAMRRQLIEMRKRVIEGYKVVAANNKEADVHAIGKCFLGYEYPTLHPIQHSKHTEIIWSLLNGSIDDFDPLYRDGVLNRGYQYDKNNQDSELEMLYNCNEPVCWGEGVGLEATDEIFLIYPFHQLFEHSLFSVYDLMWVRKFNIEITFKVEY